MITGAEVMMQCLRAEGVELIFGYPGAAICPFYDKLYHSGIRHVLVRTEQNAAHAASGYSRAGNKIGVCSVTSGPGATNLITGIATAYMDSIPLVAITGQVRLQDLGKDVFQEADITGACESFVKHSYLVKDAAELPRVFKEAFHIAQTGRPGPVLIDVPQDVQEQLVPEFVYPEHADIIGYKPKIHGHSLQIKKALDAIARAEKPLLVAGGGVAGACAVAELLALSEAVAIPIISTMMGLGCAIPRTEGYLGMMGSFGSARANGALAEADLVILCGARVADRAIRDPHGITAEVIHIDIDPAEIGKNIHADIPIVGDMKSVLRSFLQRIEPTQKTLWCRSVPDEPEYPGAYVHPKALIRAISAQMGAEDILFADPGQGQIWAANSFVNGRFFTSGGLGTMGYSIPAALGAKLARPSSLVVAAVGDGAFQMSMCELAAAVDIPIKILIMDNGRLGMVREVQNQCYDGRHMATYMAGNPNFVKMAEAYGICAAYIEKNEAVSDEIAKMLSHKGPYVLVCRVDPETPSANGGTV